MTNVFRTYVSFIKHLGSVSFTLWYHELDLNGLNVCETKRRLYLACLQMELLKNYQRYTLKKVLHGTTGVQWVNGKWNFPMYTKNMRVEFRELKSAKEIKITRKWS